MEVRRDGDDELCGHVDEVDGVWWARTVFGAVLGTHADESAARDQVLAEGMTSLTERWTLRNGETGEEEVVCIQEANPSRVTVALGYYSLPGVPSLTLTVDQLVSGEWTLHR